MLEFDVPVIDNGFNRRSRSQKLMVIGFDLLPDRRQIVAEHAWFNRREPANIPAPYAHSSEAAIITKVSISFLYNCLRLNHHVDQSPWQKKLTVRDLGEDCGSQPREKQHILLTTTAVHLKFSRLACRLSPNSQKSPVAVIPICSGLHSGSCRRR